MLDLGILMLRVATGIILIAHGIYKFRKMEFLNKKWHEHYGFPPPSVPVVGFLQIVGGVLLIVGLFTVWNSLLQLVIMLVATYISIWNHREPFLSTPDAKGWDFNFLLLVVLVVLILLGDGEWSLVALF
jgi:putative oxidoreductase